ncbi:DUF1801 domain-containing protein [Marinomonas pollencensis]|uniref:Uncharacterized protein DUF1801 n=1 Tax=Marinomonas pollencensis TaxID=491954 RepID=A0A3E0DPF0_9GAMM|nr:DUF1801 domain-containing protein [Marinomonas pollencensis]REG84824.1 uncharacterized protein DUF1801 [Marinomonas pollencensis]
MMTLPIDTFVDNYIEHASANMRADLHEIIAIMRLIAPNAELSFDFGIPYFQQDSELLFGVAAREDHLCIYFNDCTQFYSFAERLNHAQFGENCLSFHRLNDININVFAELLSQIKVHSVKRGRDRLAHLLH